MTTETEAEARRAHEQSVQTADCGVENDSRKHEREGQPVIDALTLQVGNNGDDECRRRMMVMVKFMFPPMCLPPVFRFPLERRTGACGLHSR